MSVSEEVAVHHEELPLSSAAVEPPLDTPTELGSPDIGRTGLFRRASQRAGRMLVGGLPDALAAERTQAASAELLDESTLPTRRDALKLFGKTAGLIAKTALVIDGYEAATTTNQILTAVGNYESRLWPHNEPSFQFLGNETYTSQKQVAIYLPGFGDMHSHDEAAEWHEKSNVPDLLTGYVDYSNEGTDIDTIVRLIREKIDVNQVESVIFICRSIGGLFALPVAAELGIPVKSLLLISSPSRLEYGDMGSLGEVLAELPRRRWLATLGKLVANGYHDYTVRGFDPSGNFAAAWHGTMSGASPLALQTEVRTAASIDIKAASRQKALERVFIPGFSSAVYAATNHPPTDKTVRVIESGREFGEEFNRLGISYQLIGVPYDGHANVPATAGHLRGWMQTIAAASPIPAIRR